MENYLCALARHPALPPKAQEALGVLGSKTVKRALVANTALDPGVRAQLCRDRDAAVRQVAARYLDDPVLVAQIAEKGGARERLGLALNRLTPAPRLDQWVREGNSQLARLVMTNPAASTEAVLERARRSPMKELYGTFQASCRSATAGMALRHHPALHEVWLDEPDAPVRRMLARSDSLTPEQVGRFSASKSRGGRDWFVQNVFLESAAMPKNEQARHAALRGQVETLRAQGRAGVPALMELKSPSVDLLLHNEGVLHEHVAELAKLDHPVTDPDLIAEIAMRVGPDERDQLVATLSLTRIQAAAIFVPDLEVAIEQSTSTRWPYHKPVVSSAEVAPAIEAMGSESGPWRTFIGLANSWEQGLERLVENARAIHA